MIDSDTYTYQGEIKTGKERGDVRWQNWILDVAVGEDLVK